MNHHGAYSIAGLPSHFQVKNMEHFFRIKWTFTNLFKVKVDHKFKIKLDFKVIFKKLN